MLGLEDHSNKSQRGVTSWSWQRPLRHARKQEVGATRLHALPGQHGHWVGGWGIFTWASGFLLFCFVNWSRTLHPMKHPMHMGT